MVTKKRFYRGARQIKRKIALPITAGLLASAVLSPALLVTQRNYPDGRPRATLRLDASGSVRILRHGEGPGKSDYLGAREAIAYKAGDTYYLHYDGAGPKGWLACLATSHDLRHWNLKGPILKLGAAGEDDSATASSPWTIYDGHWWHMFYVGSRDASPAPDRIPRPPYFTLKAKSSAPDGPWIKQGDVIPFRTKPGTYYSDTASPGQIVKSGDEYLMFFSAATFTDPGKTKLKRTISIARTRNINGAWSVDPTPALPLEQQLENAALYFEPSNGWWFLFANHIGLDEHGEYTEAIWVYWSKSLTHWNPENRAIALDHANCNWCGRAIGMPSVVKTQGHLVLFFDTTRSSLSEKGDPGGDMGRDLGLAWFKLPLEPPRSQ